MARRNGSHALRNLDRVEPHARRIAQTVRGAQAPHDRAVLVENLRIGSCQAEHLDLTCARDGVAVAHRNGGRVLERLRQIAAGHLAKPRKGDHLPLDDAVLPDEVAAQGSFDDNPIEFDPLGTKRKLRTRSRCVEAQRIVHITQVGGDQPVVTLHAMQQEGALRIGGGADGRAGPVDRSADQRLVVGITHHTAQVLRTERGGGYRHNKKNSV